MSEYIKEAIEHAPLAIGIAVAYWWLTPKLLKVTLMNGGGEVVRRIVREENDATMKATGESIRAATAPLHDSITQVRERIASMEGRLKEHLDASHARHA